MPRIDTRTTLCISVASRPGNFGNRFHNYLYHAMEVNFVYKSCATSDLKTAVDAIRALGIRGCGVSMPFKREVLRFLDELDPTAKDIGAVNTIVNEGGRLKGFNTDHMAILETFRAAEIGENQRVILFGSGGVACSVAHALWQLGVCGTSWVVARNKQTGKELADKYQMKWRSELPEPQIGDWLVNATPVGMGNKTDAPFPDEWVEKSFGVCDLVASPSETRLLSSTSKFGKKMIRGIDITLVQAREQFKLYTGKVPPEGLLREAFEFASQI